MICYVLFIGFMPLMHDHDHEDVCDHKHGHEHKRSEPIHSDESCLACVYLNTYTIFQIQPNVTTYSLLCCDTLHITDIVFLTFNPTQNIQSRAPPYSPIHPNLNL